MHNTRMFVRYQGQIVVAEHVAFHTMPEYRIFTAMWARCTNPNTVNWEQYGGAGIKVCEAWKDFTQFYTDMGPRPTMQHSIDRYPNGAGDYEPGNCRWATRSEQALHVKNAVFVEFEGQRERLILLCRRLGADYARVAGRLNMGWDLERALSTPTGKRGRPRKNTIDT